jgi:hypothetical protein
MLSPGDPLKAADLAGKAASVSHGGEAIYGAQVLAAMEAQAFVERDRFRLLDLALEIAPSDSAIHRMISDVRDCHAREPDWREARRFVVENYGYDKYPGGCHIVPNQALIILGLLYGNDDFQQSLMITNTCGWDTDCNSGNLGCLLGIKNGLGGIDNSPVDWRGPVADRLYLPTADGGRAITDAVAETSHIINSAHAMVGEDLLMPKGGARFHFELPGSVQGFGIEQGANTSAAGATLFNVEGHSRLGRRALAINVPRLGDGESVCVSTATFIPPDAINMPGYGLLASPTIYPGQSVTAQLQADETNPAAVDVRLYLTIYGPDDRPARIDGPGVRLEPGQWQALEWRVPSTDRLPICAIGLQVRTSGAIYLDALTWEGMPTVEFGQPSSTKSLLWRKAWVNGVDHWEWWSGEPFRLVKNEGRGLAITGTRQWRDYRFDAVIRPAFLAASGGLAVYVQGMQRYYALELFQGGVRLVKALDGRRTLAESPFEFELWQEIAMSLEASGKGDSGVHLRAWVDDRVIFDVTDTEWPLTSGAVAFVVEESHILAEHVSVRPLGAGA